MGLAKGVRRCEKLAERRNRDGGIGGGRLVVGGDVEGRWGGGQGAKVIVDSTSM